MVEKLNPEWVNLEKIEYFNLIDFISQIKLSDKILYHMELTGQDFEDYIKLLEQFTDGDNCTILYYLLDSANRELQKSAQLENHLLKNVDLFNGDLFFEKLSISHERIKKIHKFVCEKTGVETDTIGEYRKFPVTIGTDVNGEYKTYSYTPNFKDIKKFMDDFIAFYKVNSLKEVYNNPFLKGALAHLLFVRIHPFGDGNGRTARIIQNIAFTSSINKIYNTKLKLSPLNISQNILINKYTYFDRINRIHFNLDYDNYNAINSWFDFILNMYDEQLYYQKNNILNHGRTFEQMKSLVNSDETMKDIAKNYSMNFIKGGTKR